MGGGGRIGGVGASRGAESVFVPISGDLEDRLRGVDAGWVADKAREEDKAQMVERAAAL